MVTLHHSKPFFYDFASRFDFNTANINDDHMDRLAVERLPDVVSRQSASCAVFVFWLCCPMGLLFHGLSGSDSYQKELYRSKEEVS